MGDRPDREELTRLLRDAAADPSRMFGVVYDELHAMARALMQRERSDHTLDPAAVVHEAYIRLVDQDQLAWENRAHFFGMAARAMRQILVDHARARAAEKRGGSWTKITLDESLTDQKIAACDLLDLHHSLERLADVDGRSAQVVELRVFSGMTAREAAYVLGVSRRTVDGDWKFARLWLTRELAGKGA